MGSCDDKLGGAERSEWEMRTVEASSRVDEFIVKSLESEIYDVGRAPLRHQGEINCRVLTPFTSVDKRIWLVD